MVTTEYPGIRSIRGELVPPSDPRLLTQDLLEVELDNGVFIDVGWYPEHDPHGQYHIRVFLESWDLQLLDDGGLVTADPYEAEELVESLAAHYSGPLISKSLSSDLDLRTPVCR